MIHLHFIHSGSISTSNLHNLQKWQRLVKATKDVFLLKIRLCWIFIPKFRNLKSNAFHFFFVPKKICNLVKVNNFTVAKKVGDINLSSWHCKIRRSRSAKTDQLVSDEKYLRRSKKNVNGNWTYLKLLFGSEEWVYF